jgi:hypothetical protein
VYKKRQQLPTGLLVFFSGLLFGALGFYFVLTWIREKRNLSGVTSVYLIFSPLSCLVHSRTPTTDVSGGK